MAEETSRMKIPYPSQGQANYYEVYKSSMDAIDADIFALWGRANIVMHGGGNISWSLVGADYEFTFDSPIVCQIPSSGTAQSIAATTLIVPPSHFVIFDVDFGATATGALFDSVATQISIDPSSSAFCWHNPITHELVFLTGLVIALGGTATGIQPQGGGGGGSITVTDGSTTVNPTTAINFTAGAVSINDAGGGTADAQVQLTTRFVVSADGSTFYSSIQSAIDDAYAAWNASGEEQHQVIHIRPGTYTESLTIRKGIRLVADAEPQTTIASSALWGGAYAFNPTACVTVVGNHGFPNDRISASFRGIAFVAGNSAVTVFVANGTDGNTDNIVQFFDCSFYQEPDNGSVGLFTATTTTTDTSFHFEDCKFFYYGSGFGSVIVSVVGQTNFVRCSFDTSGFGGSIYLDTDDNSVGTFLFEQCWLTVVTVEVGVNSGGSATVTYRDTIHTGPYRECIHTDNASHTVALINSTCISQDGEPVASSNSGGGTLFYDRLSINPLGSAIIGFDFDGYGSPVTKITADQVRGETYNGAVDLTVTPYTYTAVSVDTSSGGVGTRSVVLPNAALLQGMMFTVWDSGGMANTRNIVVTSTGSAGGVTGPQTSITHANGSLVFLATKNKLAQACWRSVSYLH